MKTVSSVVFQSPQFVILSETQLQDLHLAALEVLRRTGIRFHHLEALDMLKGARAFSGCAGPDARTQVGE